MCIAALILEVLREKEISQGRFVCSGIHGGTLLPGGQKARAPVKHAARGQTARIGQHNVGRQILSRTTQPVGNPRAHGGEPGQDEPAIHHEHGRAVQGGLAVHGVNEGHIIHAGGQPGKEVTHRAAADAVPAKLPMAALAIARLGGKELQIVLWIKGGSGALS